MKKYPKITFSLTDEQREELASFEASVRKGSMLDESGDTRCAVMGNVWLAGDKYGTVDVYLMNIESYKLINDAIAEARKFIK